MRYGKERNKKISDTMKKRYKDGKIIHVRYWKGKKRSQETKEKLSKFWKGRTFSEETKKKLSKALKGRKTYKITPEIRKKMSNSMRGRNVTWGDKISKGRKGKYCEKNAPNWRGGKSFEPYSPEFNDKLKEQIRKRDNYRCQECFRHQNELFSKNRKIRKLDIHHIDFEKKNNNPNNLISLCLSCHMQTNFKRDNWTKYFKRRILD